MTSQSLWQPQQVHVNLLTRVSVLPTSLAWHQTSFPGIWFGCFESNHEVQDHPTTMLTRFDPGGFFPHHGHPGGEEILVLSGEFSDETGVHPPGTYMLNPEGFNHRPYSEEGCLTFVKLRQHGGKTRHQVRRRIFEEPWQTGINPQIRVQPLYEQVGFSEKVWVEQWLPGTQLLDVIETEIKEIFVIQGTWCDELGCYPAGSWLRYPVNSPYSPSTEAGCLIYVKTYPIADETERFVVGDDFQHPEEAILWDQELALGRAMAF
ncbi:cupin domain-containing protein [Leptothoe spongobia]|uniref:Cupin domain-containing protein n=1 Tax=Leptothoe spongobia TAU-MAC 1115 TaxID=1967444 RepID=A0A947GRI1_9CYAN|nr:cupin domain-containing protein [Leptothoe spongobia]MBT9317501.1 cupin domain-containing protein [Leptothoe spongobia TAU-MAC 1115]